MQDELRLSFGVHGRTSLDLFYIFCRQSTVKVGKSLILSAYSSDEVLVPARPCPLDLCDLYKYSINVHKGT
jgi:hypothetical protein